MLQTTGQPSINLVFKMSWSEGILFEINRPETKTASLMKLGKFPSA